MSSPTPLIFDFAAINKRDEEIRADRWKVLQEQNLPEQIGEIALSHPFAAQIDYDDFMG